MADAEPTRLNLAVIVPGAVALGAYEAGALAALLRLVRRSQGQMVVDTIVGASAGSITGTLLAHALLTGASEDVFEDLWVEQASLDVLLKGKRRPGSVRAPLSAELLEDWARSTLAESARVPGDRQVGPIALVMSIANLRGLRYRFAQSRPDAAPRSVSADTFRDVRSFVVDTETAWEPILETAVASSANALAFSPRSLLRRRSEYGASVEFPGDEASFWYTDGGTVYNVPIGFAIDAVFSPADVGLAEGTRERDRPPARRLFLLIHPHPDAAPSQWPVTGDPTFRNTAIRAFSLATTQSVYDDLRQAEKMNTRIAARRELQRRLEQLLPSPQEPDNPMSPVIRALGEAAWERKQQVRRAIDKEPSDSLAEELASRGHRPDTDQDILDYVLDESTGTAGKEVVQIEVVSPELESGERPVGDLLAGELLGHFFGFTVKKARQSDFGLGYRNFRAWWTSVEPAGRATVPPHPLERAEPAGTMSVRDLGWRRWWFAIRLGLRYVRELF
jgi:predicted acylesterase/phospholipase RssA